MLHICLRVTVASILGSILAPPLASADPSNLKLSFFTSDRSRIYQYSVKPFIDAVNNAGSGVLHVDVYFSGGISGDLGKQPQVVADGEADMAMIVPGRTADRFYDTSLLELPGVFRNAREASGIFAKLLSGGLLSGYEDFYVISAFVSGPESIHSRKPVQSLADLQGLTIRVNNPTEAEVLQRLGAIPVLLSINRTTEALSGGAIDGATFPPSMLSEFGVGRIATHHYMIGLGGAPVALLMNRKKFESLPDAAQLVIRTYSGEWANNLSIKHFAEVDHEVLQNLEADPLRTVIFPSGSDTKVLDGVFQDVVEQWGMTSDHNKQLLARVRADLSTMRAAE